MATLFLMAGLIVGQAAPEEADLETEVARLVAQLDASALAEREAAERALLALGPDALALLPTTDRETPAEMAQRLARIRSELERLQSESASLPTSVTLSGEMPLQEALAAISEQTGNRTAGGDNVSTRVRLDAENMNYWEAMDQLLDQARLEIETYGGQPNRLLLTPRMDGARDRQNADYRGVFRVEPIRVHAVRDFRNPMVQGLRVGIAIAWEPRLSPISISHPLEAVEVLDQDGQALNVNAEYSRPLPIQPGMSAVEFEIPLDLPPRSSDKLSRIRGQFVALIPGRQEEFVFDDNLAEARRVEMRKGGATVILDEVRRAGEIYQFRVRIRFDESGDSLESHRGWVFNNEAFLLDANGRRIPNAGLEETRRQPNEVGIAYLFAPDDGLEGCKFVYRTPAVIVRLPVEYELSDILLP